MKDLSNGILLLIVSFVAVLAIVSMLLVSIHHVSFDSDTDSAGFASHGLTSHSMYHGYATPIHNIHVNTAIFFNNLSDVVTRSFNVSDDIIYRSAYISYDNQSWTEFNLTPADSAKGEWIYGRGIANINFSPAKFHLSDSNNFTNNTYVIFYSCSRNITIHNWSCHDGWQIIPFNAKLKSSKKPFNIHPSVKSPNKNSSNDSAPVCIGSVTEDCYVANGVGTHELVCVNDTLVPGVCTVDSCDTGYTSCGNVCYVDSKSCILNSKTGTKIGYCSSGVWNWNICIVPTSSCGVSDGQCPSGCTYPTDIDCNQCSVATDCSAGTSCQTRVCSGTPKRCSFTSTTSCTAGDSCCPSGCSYAGGDTDCSSASISSSTSSSFIVDHTDTNISNIPMSCINKVKSSLHIAYTHTSHGSQIYSGLEAINAYNSLYSISSASTSNKLHFEDYAYSGLPETCSDANTCCTDLSTSDYYGGIADPTETFLDSSDNQDINVIMWAWCSIAGHDISAYLDNMQTLITTYEKGNTAHSIPVKFVFITGHSDAEGEGGTSDSQNAIIRDFVNNNAFCKSHQCVLFDYADMENYDPDNNYFLDQYVDADLSYSGGNWGDEYLSRHPSGLNANLANIMPTYGCAHSDGSPGQYLNCALKGQAAWYMFARLTGWDGVSTSCN